MSLASRRALYGKLAGDTTLNSLLGTPAPGYVKSIYYQYAPEGARYPYIIFNKQAGTPKYGMSAASIIDNEIWMVQAVDRDDEEATADDSDAIADRLAVLLTDGTVSISGKQQWYLRRESDLDYSDESDGVQYRHAGALYRLMYA